MADQRTREPVSPRRIPGRFSELNLSGRYIAGAITVLIAFAAFVTVGLIIALTSLYQSSVNPWAAAVIIGTFAAVVSVPFGMFFGALIAQILGYSTFKQVWVPKITITGLLVTTFFCCAAASLGYYAFNYASDTLPRRYLFIVVALAMPPLLMIVISLGRVTMRWLHRRYHPYNAEVIDEDIEM
ncbi:hypothetical protein LOC68_19710 [Blastopirellula sp. JC732]|uniref:Uncharacterized protein n=1 Tax=Blastopirellula sediminis TaxID=2894196 RepID=A0A9X1SHY4_9BACT|nr:hypothetical protein [Blastopirellula sediminis]MCC9606074.1 hypothetical protein [Blastopirellula sediminis]MCC9630627.1 hypothetical protein [Blastopirellula sediminis]